MGFFSNLFGNSGGNENTATLIKEGAFLVDVRTPAEFAGGHVQKSVNIPLDQVANQLAKFKGKNHIIVFCQSGNRSGQAKSILERNGFTNVTNGGTWREINNLMSK